jgi:hypothetical protein
MSRSRKRLLVRLAFTVALFASGCSALVTVNVTGGWAGDMTWTTGPATGMTQPFSLDLAQVEKDIAGTITLIGRATETYTINITFGRATGSTVEFTASGVNDVITPAVNVTFDFDGESDGTEMSGTGSANINGTTYEFTWTATLVAPPPAEE